ncbi:NUDIX domain-containing protein [Candidatus Parcubacteria bacterium]|jgi:8-oxo-dGTP diphosphatase|nr:MAG: NUDIX domain-containing protein [Candidatus Parcubacteria bacterium]
MESKLKLFVAAKALVIYKGKILLVRESANNPVGTNTGKYDVVGGRLEPGETVQECLKREVWEETGLEIKIGKPFYVTEWRPVVKGENWQIIGIFFECFADSDQVKLSQDHDAYKWLEPIAYKAAGMIENLMPVFEAYLKK